MIPYTYSNNGDEATLTVFLDGIPETIHSSHPSFDEVISRLETITMYQLRQLINIEAAYKQKVAHFGTIRIEGGQVFYKNEEVHGQLSTRMLQMLENGQDPRAWALFMENLMKNPAKHAVDELFLWLERSGMPITERGNFLAYKKVKDDYTSYHSNKDGTPFRNDIGTFCSMDRNKVDDNRHVTCSAGLHFCSWDYLPHYMGGSGKVVIVEVNPAHVVSIPSDYNNAKGRAEGYLVVGEVPEDRTEFAFASQAFASYDNSDYITFDQDDEIDYSTIDEDFYKDGWAEFDEDESNDDYDSGEEEGYRDRMAGKPRNAETAIEEYNEENPFIEITYNDSFEDGYNDGWYDAHYKLQASELEEEDVKEDMHQARASIVNDLVNQTVSVRPSAYNIGARDGHVNVKKPFAAIIEFGITTDEADQFINEYNEGWDNARAYSVA